MPFINNNINYTKLETTPYDFAQKSEKKGASTGVAPMPPATESTLEINGISVLTQGSMAFPVGHVVPEGQPGDISDYTPSEAFGYSMRNAVLAGDQASFQSLLNGFLYLVNQTTLYRQNQMGLSGSQLAQGLIGWSPNIMNILSSQSPYPSSLPNQFVSSASDADADIIDSLIMASTLWPDLVAQDTLTPAGGSIISSIAIKDLAQQTIQNFVSNELGNFTFNGTTYYAMTLDNWGHDALYPDYFDPTTFAKMIAFVGSTSAEGQSLASAAQGTIQYIAAVAAANQNWIPDSPYWLGGASSFGYDATRILMRFGEYLSIGSDPLNMAPEVSTILSNLVYNIFSNNGSYLQWQQGGTVTFTPSGLTGGAFTGPLLTALKSLNQNNQLPSDVPQNDITQVTDCLNYDLTQYQIDTMQDWQNWYFSIQLAVLNQGLIDQAAKKTDAAESKTNRNSLYSADVEIDANHGCCSAVIALFQKFFC